MAGLGETQCRGNSRVYMSSYLHCKYVQPHFIVYVINERVVFPFCPFLIFWKPSSSPSRSSVASKLIAGTFAVGARNGVSPVSVLRHKASLNFGESEKFQAVTQGEEDVL